MCTRADLLKKKGKFSRERPLEYRWDWQEVRFSTYVGFPAAQCVPVISMDLGGVILGMHASCNRMAQLCGFCSFVDGSGCVPSFKSVLTNATPSLLEPDGLHGTW